jgi:hypothetical protein
MTYSRILSIALFLLHAAGSAYAGMLGTNVTVNYIYPGFPATTDTVAVGAGVEISCTGGGSGNANLCTFLSAPNQSLDFDDLSITYVYTGPGSAFNPGGFNGFEFTNLNPSPAGYSHVSLSTDIAGLDTGDLSALDAHTVHLNMESSVLRDGNSFTLTFDVLDVPEPGSVLLALGGLTVLLLRRR